LEVDSLESDLPEFGSLEVRYDRWMLVSPSIPYQHSLFEQINLFLVRHDVSLLFHVVLLGRERSPVHRGTVG
jgi:hypothetical protein